MKLFGNYNSKQENLLSFDSLPSQYNPVLFVSDSKTKNLRIKIKSDLKITVSYPARSTLKKAEEFFQSKIIWVENSLIKMAARQKIRHQKMSSQKNQISKQDFLNRKIYLVERCKDLAQKHQFSVKNISLRRQKTIWGSCSSDNSISLNSNLAFLSDDLIDYVILHELTHVKVKNHSKKFWLELEKIMPEARKLDRQLKQFSPSFFGQLSG